MSPIAFLKKNLKKLEQILKETTVHVDVSYSIFDKNKTLLLCATLSLELN